MATSRDKVDVVLDDRTTAALRAAAERLRELSQEPWKGEGFAHQVGLVAGELAALEDDIALQAARARIKSQKPRTMAACVARNLRMLRELSGWTQTEIAEAMVQLGFVTWKRITVAEAESGKRRLSMEELIGYSILFGCTAARLALPFPDEALIVNERLTISTEEASQLLTGQIVDAGPFDEDDTVGPRIIGATEEGRDWRPIANRRIKR